MTTILITTSLTHRALDQESIITAWLKKGCQVIVVNFFDQNPFKIPPTLNRYQCISFSSQAGQWNLIKTVLRIIYLCWHYKVNLVLAHLEYPSFVSVLASFFVRSKVVVYRHHADYALLNGFDKSFSYKFTYRFAPLVIVVSNHAKRIMVEKEKIKEDKIKVLPLAFDFTLFDLPKDTEVQSLRKEFKGTILLLSVGRLTQLKRPYHSIDVIKKLRTDGIDAKLILLGAGEEETRIQKYIQVNKLEDHVFLCGFKREVLTFMRAADFIIHPSISESSSIIVKEAGLVKKPCVVCKDVGDFNEYLIHEENGFVVDPDKFVEETSCIIKTHYDNKPLLDKIGRNLNADIHKLFEVSRVIQEYERVIGVK
jgi:glycosyltransferase involved in cell wall biosynthesis